VKSTDKNKILFSNGSAEPFFVCFLLKSKQMPEIHSQKQSRAEGFFLNSVNIAPAQPFALLPIDCRTSDQLPQTADISFAERIYDGAGKSNPVTSEAG
jgi:hypothetical protein